MTRCARAPRRSSGRPPRPISAAKCCEIGVPIRNPDPPGGRIGSLILIYDWNGVQARPRRHPRQAGESRQTRRSDRRRSRGQGDRRRLVRRTAGAAIGAGRRDAGADSRIARAGSGAARSPVRRRRACWSERRASPHPLDGWSVLFVEPAAEALAAVREVRSRWIFVIVVHSAGRARRGRPPGAAGHASARRGDARDERHRLAPGCSSLPLLPVRSRNEVGQLTESFNKMTAELKRSQEEALVGRQVRLRRRARRHGRARGAHAAQRHAIVGPDARRPGRRPSADNAELVETIVAEVDRVERVVTGLIELARPLEQRLEPTRLARPAVARGELRRRAGETTADPHQLRLRRRRAAGPLRSRADVSGHPELARQCAAGASAGADTSGCARFPEDSGTVGFEVADDGPGLAARDS